MEFAIADGLYKAEKAHIIGDGGSVGIDLAQFDLNKNTHYENKFIQSILN